MKRRINLKEMGYIDLGNGYLLAGFSNLESALTATEMFYGSGFRIEYLNETACIRDMEVMVFTRGIGGVREMADQS